jgi:hypothetical protein
MSLFDEIEHLSQRLGQDMVLPIPPACHELLRQAQSAGIPIGKFMLFSQPLLPGVRGGRDRHTGDLWCSYAPFEQDALHDLLQYVLVLLASAKLDQPVPATIEQDWGQARCAHREARALALAWGREDLFTDADLAQFLALDEHLFRCHLAAGALAGTRDPFLARMAFYALLEVGRRHGWSNEQFEAALAGEREDDEAANAAVLDFDRSVLRAYWRSTHTRRDGNEVSSPLGAFALAQTTKTAAVLRAALEQVARRRAANHPHFPSFAISHNTFLSFVRLEGETDLSQAIAYVNTCLIEAFPHDAAHVQWTLYANQSEAASEQPSARIYRFRVEYVSREEQAKQASAPVWREWWVLLPAQRCPQHVEAAWQRYLCAWRAWADPTIETLEEGMRALWSQLV